MLHNLRAASETWTGRIVSTLLMGFIVLSFSVFGIGDFFRGFGVNKVASVGSVEITAEAYRSAWNDQLQRLSAGLKRNVTSEEARAAGMDRQLLGQLVADAAVAQRGDDLGQAISTEAINAIVTADPKLKNPAGEFDRTRFLELLRQNNFTERSYLEEQRKTILRQEQVEAVSGALNPPVTLLEMLNRVRNERRSADYFLLPAAAAGDLPSPSEEELSKYFAVRAQNFRAPEYRKLVVLALRPDALAKPEAVSDEAAMKRYDEVKLARYIVPERRSVQQLPFPGEAEAAAALAKIRAGASFDEFAAQNNLQGKGMDLGLVPQSALIGDVGPAAFALAEGAVSEPVKNVFGYSLLRVSRIEPGSTRTFAEAAGEIKREIALAAARKEAQGLHDRIEDARASGKPLAEAAAAAGLTVRTIEAVDAAGRDKAGLPVPDMADGAALLKAAFASDVGVDNDTVQTKDRGTIWFEVATVEPARNNSLEEVRAKVEEAWREDERARRLTARAAELVKKISEGADIAAVAAEAGGLEVKHIGDARRQGSPELPDTVIVQLFNARIGAAGSALAPGGRIVFKALDKAVQPMDAASPEARKLEADLRAALSDELFTQYVAQLKDEAGVRVNDALLRQLSGSQNSGP